MSEYVKITSSAADIIGAAAGMSAQGEAVSADVSRLIGEIEDREGPDTLGTDDFWNGDQGFKHTYQKPIEMGDGSQAPANEATKQAAQSVGDRVTKYADAITGSMTDYLTTEGMNEAGIRSV
ncbi:MAG: hypothetical protein J2P15_00455 [Micromonosporaceae bacterium]|nr:hypothetical protein [Micromonosporaceae bacterium]